MHPDHSPSLFQLTLGLRPLCVRQDGVCSRGLVPSPGQSVPHINDSAGMARDREEGNTLSRIFHFQLDSDGKILVSLGAKSKTGQHQNIRNKLLWIAEDERRVLNVALSLPKSELGKSDDDRGLIDAMMLFIDATDL
ncbi:hypothetical protein F5Y13DRAFT_160970 [Hypoxylon sp. FL1857]|nr:hypothetical protein F5Y13DRAFT_160970 [Hypoxylon sp. FL1857]